MSCHDFAATSQHMQASGNITMQASRQRYSNRLDIEAKQLGNMKRETQGEIVLRASNGFDDQSYVLNKCPDCIPRKQTSSTAPV